MSTSPQRHRKDADEVRNVAVDFTGKLDSGELLSGTPTVAEVDTADLTISNAGLNTVARVIAGRTVAISKAVQFKVAGGLSGVTYTIRITVATNSTPAQSLIEDVKLAVD